MKDRSILHHALLPPEQEFHEQRVAVRDSIEETLPVAVLLEFAIGSLSVQKGIEKACRRRVEIKANRAFNHKSLGTLF
jgi:hypothetical protein